MASQRFNQKKKDLTAEWLEKNGYRYEVKSEGLVASNNSNKQILFKSFGRERSLTNQDTKFTLKRGDFEVHNKQAAKLDCLDLVYSLYLERPSGSYQLIVKQDFLKKEFINNATINFNSENFDYFRSRDVEILLIT